MGGGAYGTITVNNAIDGKVFLSPNFDFNTFYLEGKVQSNIPDSETMYKLEFKDNSSTIYPRTYNANDRIIELGKKSYIVSSTIEGRGLIQIGHFSSIGWDVVFEMALNNDHHYRNISSYGICRLDWQLPRKSYFTEESLGNLYIGSDVWIGRGCRIKASNSDKPLIIGNGAIIAADSVVVNNIPPFAIVGGNPAKIIKYRFDQDTIKILEKIAWWNWDIQKIYENYNLFSNPEEFIQKFKF
ncbi:MAG: CatB-related O-acetyltransferase [Selenomonadaceae bacterium]|nr:CatB-related O-acetyltransferase [Selenomonadaceae bacterium]